MPKQNLMNRFTALQLRRIMDTRRVRDEISTGKSRFTFRGESFIISYGIKSRTVHSVVAA